MRKNVSHASVFAVSTWVVFALSFVSGCGSDVGRDACEEGQPCEGGGVCTVGVCTVPDAVGGDVDATAPPVDVVVPVDVDPPEDVPPGPDTHRDVPQMDTVPPDLIPDRSGPVVIDFSPENGEDGVATEFVVRIEFDEAVRPTTIVPGDTFSVTDILGKEVAGDMELLPDPQAPRVILFRPSQAIDFGSPYYVKVTPSIMDLLGNRMEEFVRFRFFTEPLTTPEDHRAVAERYAPHIRQSTSGTRPEYDYLTAFDFDRDFDLTNNVEALKKADAVPAKVYYAVVETRSHWFITYLYYHPYRAEEDGAFGNDLAGAQIVVQRVPDEKPVLVQLYFKTDTQEDILAYVSAESGLTGAYVDDTFPQVELFPDGHYPAYLTTVSHQSCLWIDLDNTGFQPCRLAEVDVDGLAIVEYVFQSSDVAEALVKLDGVFPHETGDDPVAYALEDVLRELWPRRMDVEPGGVVFAEDFAFPSDTGRPGAGVRLGSVFVNPTTSDRFGRPGWAWLWKPQAGGFVDLARGSFFLDPAYFLKKRFPALPAWDDATKTGFSLDYCYNPFLDINVRASVPDCAPAR